MNLVFKRLEAINFGSWKHLVFDFQKGKMLIVGRTGAGKSTIPRALFWALYGETPEGWSADDVVNEQSKKNTMVKLIVPDRTSKDIYEIIRYRRHVQWKNKVVILKNGKRFGEKDSKIEVINQWIINFIGLTPKEFLKTVLYVQRDNERFPALTDTQQKRHIEALTELKLIPKAEEITRQKLQATSSMIKVLSERRDQQKESISSAQQFIKEEVKHVKKEQGIIKASIKEAKSRLDEARADFKTFQADYDAATKTQKRVNKQILEAEAMVSVLETESKRLDRRFRNWEETAKPGAVCDKCGSVLTDETIRVSTDILNTDREKTAEKLTDLKAQIKTLQKEYDLKEIERLQAGIRESERKIEKWRTYLKSRKRELAEKTPSTQSITDTLDVLKGKLYRTIMMRRFARKMQRRLEFWTTGFGRRGIRALMLPFILKDLTRLTNLYLEIFQDVSIKASYWLKDGKIVQAYTVGSKLRSYATLSGGERQMVDISSSFALRNIAEQSRASFVDCIILDEPLEGLDESLVRYVPQLLERVSQNKRSTIVISHQYKLLEPFFKLQRAVVKTNHISSFQEMF